jgi:ABC-type bacteriocin/lantibiotic exporter with double-glycine peptidase domain
MLLGMSYKKKDFLYLNEPDIDRSASLKDLMVFARKEGLDLGAYRIVNKEELFTCKQNPPLLLPIAKGNFLHMVVVRKINKRSVLIQDPASGIYFLSKKKLLSIWNGEYLEILNKYGSNFKLKKRHFVPP